jgi:prepilin-type N-terminal cleavage/methylation domain-containing protein
MKKKGFTLIELMIVIAIIAILAAILVPNFLRARAQGQFTQCQSNCKNIGTSLEMYSTDSAGHYPAAMTKLTPDYLKIIPSCASKAAETYTAAYTEALNPDAYTFYCNGTNHAALGIGANYPQYNSINGLTAR